MASQAQVRSLESIETFRNALILYLSKARPLLESVTSDVLRLRMWLQNEQRMTWEAEVKRRQRKMDDAQQSLYSARLSTLRDAVSAEQLAVHKAKRALEEAQAKLNLIKLWNRDFDGRVQPLVKALEKLDTVFGQNLLEGVSYLTQVVQRLSEYAQVSAQPGNPAPTGGPTLPPTDTDPSEEKA